MSKHTQIINILASEQVEEEYMRDFNQNDRGGNRGGGGRRFGGRDSGPRTMHNATCSSCGKDCQVPFRPTGAKPVYCSSCFGEKGGNDNRRFGGEGNDRYSRDRDNRSSGKPAPNYNKQFEEMEKKLETILDVVLNMKKAMRKAHVGMPVVETPVEPMTEIMVEEEVEKPIKAAKAKKTKSKTK